MRQCKSCDKNLPLNGEYYPRNWNKKTNKYTYRRSCKICYNSHKKQTRDPNYNKRYYKENKERILLMMKEKKYYQNYKKKNTAKEEHIIKELEYQLNFYKNKINQKLNKK